MIELALIISLCCLGFRAITGKGMVFYFMREWLDNLKTIHVDGSYDYTTIKRNKKILYIFKPIILCSTCMASIHTLIWYPILTSSFTWEIIPIMLIVAMLNTFGWLIIETLQKYTK